MIGFRRSHISRRGLRKSAGGVSAADHAVAMPRAALSDCPPHPHRNDPSESPPSKAFINGWPRFTRYMERFLAAHNDPRTFWYPGLASHPWHESTKFPAVGVLESAFASIRAEWQALQHEAGFQPEMEPIHRTGQWNVFMLYELGRKNEHNCSKCPETTRIIESISSVRSMLGLAYFSYLAPGTRILPHKGPTNMRLRCHLALQVPTSCGIRVDTQERVWQTGQCLVFDDSFEHEAWNNGDVTRAVLVVDLWHPDLTMIEMQALKGLHRHVHLQAEQLAHYWRRNEEGRSLMIGNSGWL